MLTGVVVSASSFLWVVVILYFFISKLSQGALNKKTRRIERSPGFKLGLHLISVLYIKNYPAAMFCMVPPIGVMSSFCHIVGTNLYKKLN